MMELCIIDDDGFFVSSIQHTPGSPIPPGLLRIDPPETPGDWFFSGFSGGWVQADRPTKPDPIVSENPTAYDPIQISRIDFTRLFTGAQQASINAFRKACAALTRADYADPSAGLLIQLEIVFQQFDLPAEFIELNHPDTRLGLELLAYAGVFGEDPSSALAEVERILTGIPLS